MVSDLTMMASDAVLSAHPNRLSGDIWICRSLTPLAYSRRPDPWSPRVGQVTREEGFSRRVI